MRKRILKSVLALVFAVGACGTGPAAAQCILANPSFEIGGSGGAVFGGWNQFGTVGSVSEAVHGSRAARVSGPDLGDWGVSGYWQLQDSAPGEQWDVTGHVLHPAGKPLTGENTAIVNVEWRDAAGELIAYDSRPVADASTPTDQYIAFSFRSLPAPAGTRYTILLFGTLQSPTDPSADVHYDQFTFFSADPPTIDEVQWNDFPGGRTLSFAGRDWRVKGPGYYGPGPNLFSDDTGSVWVDGGGRLHLTVRNIGGNWYSTEVVTEEALGYGDYVLSTVGRLDLVDPQVVLGIFLWMYGPCWDYAYLWWNAFNEIDIEYSRWEDPASDLGQFVAQPYDWPGNIERFDLAFGEDEVVSHAMRWLADRVEYRVWRGGPDDESAANLVHAWTYTGPHIPRPEQPRLHLNLWRISGSPATDQEIVFTDFRFVPDGAVSTVGGASRDLPQVRAGGRMFPAVPNPFNPRTTVAFELARSGPAELAVYDLAGKRVRTLAGGVLVAGRHRATWNGLDDSGHNVASGVYLVVLKGRDFLESRRVTLLK